MLELPGCVYSISWAQEAIPNSNGTTYHTSEDFRVIILANKELPDFSKHMKVFFGRFPQGNGWKSVPTVEDDKFYIYYADLKT